MNVSSSCLAHQVSLGGDGDEDGVVADAHLLALGALLGGGMHRPPARLALRLLLQPHVERQFVAARAARQARQVLNRSK